MNFLIKKSIFLLIIFKLTFVKLNPINEYTEQKELVLSNDFQETSLEESTELVGSSLLSNNVGLDENNKMEKQKSAVDETDNHISK